MTDTCAYDVNELFVTCERCGSGPRNDYCEKYESGFGL